ncbi:MAG: Rv2175c family DNA-binding protein [Actinomycetia bacterium]|nr:Rv2175c family DNA-binding protein [Actinomycetes bacterium]
MADESMIPVPAGPVSASAALESLSVAEAAQVLGVAPNRVAQLLREGQLVASRDATGRARVPAAFLQAGAVVKGLPGVITLLRDARFSDDEIVDWLAREDDSLPGRPIEALREDRGGEVKRRAQAAGF